MDDQLAAGEALLGAWLSLTSTLWNTRLVSSMTFNEAHVLGLLLHGAGDGAPMTATGLIARTHLLKSQMNKVLTSLERRGYIARARAESDRRLVLVRVTPQGEAAYRSEHARIEAILLRLVGQIGAPRALSVAAEIDGITARLDAILSSPDVSERTP